MPAEVRQDGPCLPRRRPGLVAIGARDVEDAADQQRLRQARDHRRITARDRHEAAFNSLVNEAYHEARADAACP